MCSEIYRGKTAAALLLTDLTGNHDNNYTSVRSFLGISVLVNCIVNLILPRRREHTNIAHRDPSFFRRSDDDC